MAVWLLLGALLGIFGFFTWAWFLPEPEHRCPATVLVGQTLSASARIHDISDLAQRRMLEEALRSMGESRLQGPWG